LIPVILFSCAGNRKLIKEINRKKPVHLAGNYQPEKNNRGGYDYIFYLDKGDKIPYEINIDTAYLDLSEKKVHLVLKKKLYFFIRTPVKISEIGRSKISDEEKNKLFSKIIIYISPDGKKWASLKERSSIKKVFGIKGGTLSVGIGSSKDTGIKGILSIVLK
jgi:hypothetical protein